MRKLLKQSAYSGIIAISSLLLGLVTSIVTARLLGPTGRGGYSFALLLINTVGFVMNPGLYTAANYHASLGQMDKGRVVQTSFLLTLPFSGGAFVVASVLHLTLTTIIPGNYNNDLGQTLLTGVGAFAATMGSSLTGVLYGYGQVRALTKWTLMLVMGQILVILASIVLAHASIAFYVGVYAISLSVDAVAKFLLAKRMGQWHGKPQRNDFIRFLSYGTKVYVGRVGLFVAQRVDTYLVLLLAGQAALGYYSISTMFAEQLWLLPLSVSLVMMTNIASLDTIQAAQVTTKASQYVTLFSIVGAASLGVIGTLLIPFLYGEDFRPSILPFLIMLPGMVFNSTYPIIEPFFQSRNKPWIPVWITIGSAVANFVLSFFLISCWGIGGAAVAFTVSYAIQLWLTLNIFAVYSGTARLTSLNVFVPVSTFYKIIIDPENWTMSLSKRV